MQLASLFVDFESKALKGKGLTHIGDGERLVNEQPGNNSCVFVRKAPVHCTIGSRIETTPSLKTRTICLRISPSMSIAHLASP
jgi:hypothetical protein